MYQIKDTERYRDVLRGLLGLTCKDDTKLHRIITKFKAENYLPSDGIVDYTTFNMMIKAKRESNTRAKYQPLCRGMQSCAVESLNAMLREILPTVSVDASLPRGGYYGKETASAVRLLRHVFMMTDADALDDVDPQLYERLTVELEYVRHNEDLGIYISI